MACLIKEEIAKTVRICMKDAYHRFIWVQVEGPQLIYVVGCYILHHESPFYAKQGLDAKHSFHEVSQDITYY